MSGTPRLRVLHLAKFYPPVRGGMERVLQALCESTAGDVENSVLAAHTSRLTIHERVGAIPVTRAGRLLQVGSVAVCPSFPLWLRRLAVDVAVVHEPNPLALVADWLVMSKGPLIVWFHADLVRSSWKYNWLYKPFLQRALRRATFVIVSSPRLAESSEGLRDVRAKCVVVPFGVDAGSFERVRPTPRWLAEFRQKNPGPLVLMVGRMVPYKGVDVLLRALTGTELPAVIVGSGPELARYRSLVSALGLNGRVHFAGSVPDEELVAAYQTCDLFVLPSVSRQETFGVVQLEAMACGKPVICTDLATGVPWVNMHGITGLVVPPNDVERLRSAIIELASDPELRGRLGSAAKERVKLEFTLQRARERLLAVYRATLATPGTSALIAVSDSTASDYPM